MNRMSRDELLETISQIINAPLCSDEAVAFHEAGHAVIALATGNWIREKGVTIDDDGNGYCDTRLRANPGYIASDWRSYEQRGDVQNRRYLRRKVYRDVIELLAGWTSEHNMHEIGSLYTRQHVMQVIKSRSWEDYKPGEPMNDLVKACCCLVALQEAEGSNITRTLRRFRNLQRHTGLLVRKHWVSIEKTAQGLIENRHLDGDDVHQIVGDIATRWCMPARMLRS